ncbi:MAG: hypothetical protein JWM80_5260 [Cyanobacteria bacterium RYN_339]|nr:hypothetical protein [Cyanobacteria bacterium RYN_339]
MSLERLAQRFLTPTLERVATSGEKTVVKTAAAEQAKKAAALLDRSVLTELGAANQAIKKRWPQLLAEKYKRMAESMFAFFRGSDDLFIKDAIRLDPTLAKQPKALLQGDLHLNNLGAMLKGDSAVRYGMTDFDEAAAGPVLLDLRRLATSLHLVADERGLTAHETDKLVEKLAKAYRKRLGEVASGTAKAVEKEPKAIADMLAKAMKEDPAKWLDKLAPAGASGRALARDATALDVHAGLLRDLQTAFKHYRTGLTGDAAKALDGYAVTDAVSSIGGVGSVGRGRYRVLAQAPGKAPMLFELKEELPSLVKGQLHGGPAFKSEADRVVSMIKTANPDLNPFVGLTTMPTADALSNPSFMVKRLFPQSATVDFTAISGAQELQELVERVAQLTADTHARGAEVGLASAQELLDGLGPKKAFAHDLKVYARGYADQVKVDYKAFLKALESDPLLEQPVVRGRG